jgi:hypothetical protein
MPTEELGYVLKMPICSKCKSGPLESVARIVRSEKIVCSSCYEPIDLRTKEWTAFRQKFAECLDELQPLYAQLP